MASMLNIRHFGLPTAAWEAPGQAPRRPPELDRTQITPQENL